MALCRRCGANREIGVVRTFNSHYSESWDEAGRRWVVHGFQGHFRLCTACIHAFERWAEGRDRRLPDQKSLEEFGK